MEYTNVRVVQYESLMLSIEKRRKKALEEGNTDLLAHLAKEEEEIQAYKQRQNARN